MKEIFKCDLCDYQTDRLFCMKRHENSKRHNTNLKLSASQKSTVGRRKMTKGSSETDEGRKESLRPVEKSSSNKFRCEYCEQEYFDKSNKSRHYKTCSYKKAHDNLALKFEEKLKQEMEKIEKEKIAEKERMENEKMLVFSKQREVIEEKEELEISYKQLEKELMDLLKKVSLGELGGITNNIQNQNNQNINVCYIIKNYNNAKNYYDIMSQPLTEEELDYIRKVGPSEGCATLIKNRCIDPYDIEERPFHCVDTSRVKFILKDANGWQNDLGGKKIYKGAVPKVHEGYMKDAEALEPEELCKRHKKLHSMHKDEKKIMTFIAGKSDCKTLIKN